LGRRLARASHCRIAGQRFETSQDASARAADDQADFAYERFAQAAIARLEEIRLAAAELRFKVVAGMLVVAVRLGWSLRTSTTRAGRRVALSELATLEIDVGRVATRTPYDVPIVRAGLHRATIGSGGRG
jgi:ribosomal protein S11